MLVTSSGPASIYKEDTHAGRQTQDAAPPLLFLELRAHGAWLGEPGKDILAACPVEAAPAVGLGAEYRLAGEGLAGATLVVEGRVAHLMVFPVQPAH